MHTYVEPRQSAPWLPEPSLVLAAGALLHPCDGPDPVLGFDIPEIFLLFVQIRSDVVAHKREKAGNRKSLVAVSQYLKVYGLLIVEVAEEGYNGVDGNHYKNADDAIPLSILICTGKACKHTASAHKASGSA